VGRKRNDQEAAADVAIATRHYADVAKRLVQSHADETDRLVQNHANGLRALAERERVDLSDPQTRRIVTFVIEALGGHDDGAAQLRAVRAWISILAE
jgi:hypothetical protein